MKNLYFLLTIPLFAFTPCEGSEAWGEEPFGVVIKPTTLWIGMPDKEEAMAYLRLPEGTEVRVIGEEVKYYKITHNELIGYVDRTHIRLLGTGPESIAETPAVKAPLKKESPKPSYVSTSGRPASGMHNVTQATSLRTGPDSQEGVILRLPEGGQVEVLESTGKYWWKVSYKGKTGWAKAALLQKQ